MDIPRLRVVAMQPLWCLLPCLPAHTGRAKLNMRWQHLPTLRATRRGQAPASYPKRRIPLICVVIAALLAGALA